MKGILTGLCAAAAVLEASADWRDEMWRHSIEPREGVTVRAYALEEPRVMKAYVARIDMTTPGIGFTATERSARWGERIPESTNAVLFAETKRETTCDFMERRRAEGRNVEVAFNTTPWKPWPMPKGCEYCDPVGWCVADGVEVSLHAEERSEALFLVYRDGHCAITSVVSPDDAEKVAFAANGFDILMTNGIDVATINRPEDEAPRPRMALGLADRGRTLVLLAIDGRQPGYSLGGTFADVRALLHREGVADAVLMDGGGSTSLVVFDRKNGRPYMLNRHPDGRVRANATNFGITFGGDGVCDAERTAAAYHSYEFHEIEDTPPPEGYRPFYVSHYGRHGSRHLRGTHVADALAVLENAANDGVLADEGRKLLSAMRIVGRVHDGMIGQLAERGAEEHRILARRMAARFPQVFEGRRRVRCRATVSPRVIISQTNFAMSLKDVAPGLEFDFATGDRFQQVLLPLQFARNGKPRQRPDLGEFDADGMIRRFFLQGAKVADATAFADNLFACVSICQCIKRELGGIDLYRFFSQEELVELSRRLQMDQFSGMGNSVEFGSLPVSASAKLARDFAECADNAIADGRVAADLRFGHDSGLWPLAAFIGIEGPSVRVTVAESVEKCPGWKWMPMASNLQMVFYSGKGDPAANRGEILVKVLYNEREMRVKGIVPAVGPYYRWADVRRVLLAGHVE